MRSSELAEPQRSMVGQAAAVHDGNNPPHRRCTIRTDRGGGLCGVAWKAACVMSESAERTPALPGPVAPAAPAGQTGSAHVQGTRLQRRPTGAPPPLPHPVRVSTTAWLVLAVMIVACAFLFSAQRTPADGSTTGPTPGSCACWRSCGRRGLPMSPAGSRAAVRLGRHSARPVGGGADHDLPALAASGWSSWAACSSWRSSGQWIYFGLSRPRPYGILDHQRLGRNSAPSARSSCSLSS